MTARKADLAGLPNWPRLLSRDHAAAYVGLSPNTFDDWAAGLPRLTFGKRLLWDRKVLDRHADNLSGLLADEGPGLGGIKWGKSA